MQRAGGIFQKWPELHSASTKGVAAPATLSTEKPDSTRRQTGRSSTKPPQKMIPLSLLQASYSPLCAGPQPALTLWPATSLIFGQLEDDLLSMMTEMERRMQCVNLACQYMDKTKRLTRGRQTEPTRSEKSPPRTELGEMEQFELSLDVSPFSPEELTVKTAGRRLLVTGKREQKSDSEDGSFFHEYREWRREAELPEDVRPEDVLCSLSEDGQLLIQAPRLALPAAKERAVSISVTPAPGNEEEPSEPQSSSVNGEPEGGLSAPAEH